MHQLLVVNWQSYLADSDKVTMSTATFYMVGQQHLCAEQEYASAIGPLQLFGVKALQFYSLPCTWGDEKVQNKAVIFDCYISY